MRVQNDTNHEINYLKNQNNDFLFQNQDLIYKPKIIPISANNLY